MLMKWKMDKEHSKVKKPIMWETFPIEQIHGDKRSFTMKEK